MIAVLGVAGLGLLIDRVILGSDVTAPAETSAGVFGDVTSDPASLLIVPDKAVKADLAGTGPAESLAHRLRRVTGEALPNHGSTGRDAFTPPLSWTPTGIGPEAGREAAMGAEAFKREHKLDAVLVTGDQRCAVINGHTVYIGQAVQGYRLTSVHERSAEFRAGGVTVSLVIRGAAQSP